MKRLLALAGLAVLFAAPAFADVPGSEGAGNAPDCHGQNEVPCRPDPQPEHGNDCTRSDDHVCVTTTTTDTAAPTTSTTRMPPTTSTSQPASGTTSTTAPVSAAPAVSTTPAPTTAAPAPTGTPTAAPTSTPGSSELPRTGSDVRILLAMGMSALLIGALLLKVAQ